MSIIVMLTGAYYVSQRKTTKLMFELLGINISLGAVNAVEGRISEALEATVQEVDVPIEQNMVRAHNAVGDSPAVFVTVSKTGAASTMDNAISRTSGASVAVVVKCPRRA